ncbi:Lysostaphin [Chelonia mydas]|uniref:Lysostaphin n=1 Tax=Chelonia mydas TaxID=8469 RepID=M7B4C7_CHEMY|nr:Lysostaphin [Chelonia mydas]
MRGLALKSTSPFRIRVSVDAIGRYWPPGAIPQCTIVTALDSTLNADALARCTGKAPGTFESHFLFGQVSSSAQVTMQSQNRKRAPAWTKREVLDLIAVWGEESMLSELRSKRRIAKTFQKISEAMRDRGYSRDATQCCVKFKELRQAYQKTKESNGRSRTEPQTCRFYAELHAILGGVTTTTPPLSVDSDDGVLSAMPEDFAHGEDEEEEEEPEESTQHTVLPDSQDLFLTLTEIPSQPNQAGEGTFDATNLHVAAAICTVLDNNIWKGFAANGKLIQEGNTRILDSGLERGVVGKPAFPYQLLRKWHRTWSLTGRLSGMACGQLIQWDSDNSEGADYTVRWLLAVSRTAPLSSAQLAVSRTAPLSSAQLAVSRTAPLSSAQLAVSRTAPLSSAQLAVSRTAPLSSAQLAVSRTAPLSSAQLAVSRTAPLSSAQLAVSRTAPLSSAQLAVSRTAPLSSAQLAVSRTAPLSSAQLAVSRTAPLSSAQLAVSRTAPLSSAQLAVSRTAPLSSAQLAVSRTAPLSSARRLTNSSAQLSSPSHEQLRSAQLAVSRTAPLSSARRLTNSSAQLTVSRTRRCLTNSTTAL